MQRSRLWAWISQFFQNQTAEMRKINWTAKEELISSAKFVIMSIILLSFLIYGFDLLVHGGLAPIGRFLSWMF